MNPSLIEKLTPDAAERMLMAEMMLKAKAATDTSTTTGSDAGKPAAAPKPVAEAEWPRPRVGEIVFARKDALGSEIGKDLAFSGTAFPAMKPGGEWAMAGSFYGLKGGSCHSVLLGDFWRRKEN